MMSLVVLTSRERTALLFNIHMNNLNNVRSISPSQHPQILVSLMWGPKGCCDVSHSPKHVTHVGSLIAIGWESPKSWVPSPNKWIKAQVASYLHFPCLFAGRWYLMSPYRGRTALVHMPCYHTGPFPGAPTGRVGSQGTLTTLRKKGKKKKNCGHKMDFEWRAV